MLDKISSGIDFLNGIVWSDWLVYLCFIVGVYFSIRGKFPQIRYFVDMFKLTFKGKEKGDGVSPYQSFVLTVGARVGTANIVGVAAAIAFGGPGSIFWMWILAILGAATSFIECTLAQVYKEKIDGEYYGGTSYYIDRGLKMKGFAIAFAAIAAIVNGIAGPGIHTNAIASAFEISFGLNPTITGVILVALVGIICFGGVKRIVRASELLVPIMAVGYILAALIIVVLNITKLPDVIATIISSAFGQDALFGGIMGSALSWGVMRGVYSNEAGLGTATNAAAAAETSHPAKQGLIQSLSIYIDTIVICTATAFLILVTDCYNVFDANGTAIVENLPGMEEGAGYAISAIGTVFGDFGGILVSCALALFAFTSLIAGYYSGEANAVYVFKNGKARKVAVMVVRILTLVATFYGTQVAGSVAWSLTDLGYGIMAWMNLAAILLLGGVAFKVLKDYTEQRNNNLDPIFRPDKLGIKDADIWNEINK